MGSPRSANEAEWIIGFTTAPEAYDSFGTATLRDPAGSDNRGYPLRKVAIRPDHFEWQATRYASGLHGFARESEARRFSTIWRLDETE